MSWLFEQKTKLNAEKAKTEERKKEKEQIVKALDDQDRKRAADYYEKLKDLIDKSCYDPFARVGDSLGLFRIERSPSGKILHILAKPDKAYGIALVDIRFDHYEDAEGLYNSDGMVFYRDWKDRYGRNHYNRPADYILDEDKLADYLLNFIQI
jgi:hypothetical protein